MIQPYRPQPYGGATTPEAQQLYLQNLANQLGGRGTAIQLLPSAAPGAAPSTPVAPMAPVTTTAPATPTAPAPTPAPAASAAPAASVGNLPYTPGAMINAVPMAEDWQMNLGKQVGDFLSQSATGYNPGDLYTGQRTAGLSTPEQTGLDTLNQALAIKDPGALFAQGKGEVSNILSGAYTNPDTSPYIQAIKAVMERELQGQIDKSRLGAGARGSYYGTKAMEEETGLRQKSMQDLGVQIADMMNKERDRMTAMVPEAKAYANYENVEFPMAQVGASQQYGALPRAVEQADMESKYQDWTRGRGELTGTTGQAMDMFKAAPDYGLKQIQMPNTLDTSTLTPEAIAQMFAGGGVGGVGTTGGGGVSSGGRVSSGGGTGGGTTSGFTTKTNNAAGTGGVGATGALRDIPIASTPIGSSTGPGGTGGGTPVKWDKSSLEQPSATGTGGGGAAGTGIGTASAATPGTIGSPFGPATPKGGPGQMSYAEVQTMLGNRYPGYVFRVDEKGIYGAQRGSGATSGTQVDPSQFVPLSQLLQKGMK